MIISIRARLLCDVCGEKWEVSLNPASPPHQLCDLIDDAIICTIGEGMALDGGEHACPSCEDAWIKSRIEDLEEFLEDRKCNLPFDPRRP